MNIERCELLRSYRFGENNMRVDVSRFVVGERGITAITFDGVLVRIEADEDALLVPVQHVDWMRPARADVATSAARAEAGRKGAAKRWGKSDPPEVA